MKTYTSKKVSCLHYPTCAFSKNKWIKKFLKVSSFHCLTTDCSSWPEPMLRGVRAASFDCEVKGGRSQHIGRPDIYLIHEKIINQHYNIHQTVNKGFLGVRNFWGLNFRILRIKFPGFLSHFWQGIRTSCWVVIWFCVLTFFRMFQIFSWSIFRIITKQIHIWITI